MQLRLSGGGRWIRTLNTVTFKKTLVFRGRLVHNFALTIPGPDLGECGTLRREVHLMPEWAPVILSVCLGACLRLVPDRLARIASASIGIVLLASCAFVASGECFVSWTYFLFDLVQASLGFAAGGIAVHFISRTSNSLRRRLATPD